MGQWENSVGESDEWYTPKYIFDAIGETFDVDVAAPVGGPIHVPTKGWFSSHSLDIPWNGYVWMNPPFGGRNGIVPWLDKFFAHGNGIALTPDRTSAPWWQNAAKQCDALLLIGGKVKFIRPDGSIGKSPGTGTTLFASGDRAAAALRRASAAGLGTLCLHVMPTVSATYRAAREVTDEELNEFGMQS